MSEMYKLTTYLKDLPLQSVSSKRNLQVVDLKICVYTNICIFIDIKRQGEFVCC